MNFYDRFREPEYECRCCECDKVLREDEGGEIDGWNYCDKCYEEEVERRKEDETVKCES